MSVLKAQNHEVRNSFQKRLDILLEENEEFLNVIRKELPTKKGKITERPPTSMQGMSVRYYNGMKFFVTPPENNLSLVYGKNGLAGFLISNRAIKQDSGKFSPEGLNKVIFQAVYNPEEIQADKDKAKNLIIRLWNNPHDNQAEEELMSLGLGAFDVIKQKLRELVGVVDTPPTEREAPKAKKGTVDLPTEIGRPLWDIQKKLRSIPPGEKESEEAKKILKEKELSDLMDRFTASPTNKDLFNQVIKTTVERGLLPENNAAELQQRYDAFLKSLPEIEEEPKSEAPKPERTVSGMPPKNAATMLRKLFAKEAINKNDELLKSILKRVQSAFTGLSGIMKIYEKLLVGTEYEGVIQRKKAEFFEALKSHKYELQRSQADPRMAQASRATYDDKVEMETNRLATEILAILKEAIEKLSYSPDEETANKFSNLKPILLDLTIPLGRLSAGVPTKTIESPSTEGLPEGPTPEAPSQISTFNTDEDIKKLVGSGVLPQQLLEYTPEGRQKYILDLISFENPNRNEYIDKIPGSIINSIIGGSSDTDFRPFIFGAGWEDDRPKAKEKKKNIDDLNVEKSLGKPFETAGAETHNLEGWIQIFQERAGVPFRLDSGIPKDVQAKEFPLVIKGTIKHALDAALKEVDLASVIQKGAVNVGTTGRIAQIQAREHLPAADDPYIAKYTQGLKDPHKYIGYIIKFRNPVNPNEWTRVSRGMENIWKNKIKIAPDYERAFLRFQDFRDPEEGDPSGKRSVDAIVDNMKSTKGGLGGWEFDVVPTSVPNPFLKTKPGERVVATGTTGIEKPSLVKTTAPKRELSPIKMVGGEFDLGEQPSSLKALGLPGSEPKVEPPPVVSAELGSSPGKLSPTPPIKPPKSSYNPYMVPPELKVKKLPMKAPTPPIPSGLPKLALQSPKKTESPLKARKKE